MRRLRFGGGDADADGDRARGLRERWGSGERERRASFDRSLRFLSRDRDRERSLRLLCRSLERSRLLSRGRSLSLDRSPRRSLERLLFRSVDFSRLPSLSRRLSPERSLLRPGDLSRFLSSDASRGLLYGSGDRRRVGMPASTAGDSGFALRCCVRSRGLAAFSTLLCGTSRAEESASRACAGPFLDGLSRLRLLVSLRCGTPFRSCASFCVRSLRALNGDNSLAMLGPLLEVIQVRRRTRR